MHVTSTRNKCVLVTHVLADFADGRKLLLSATSDLESELHKCTLRFSEIKEARKEPIKLEQSQKRNALNKCTTGVVYVFDVEVREYISIQRNGKCATCASRNRYRRENTTKKNMREVQKSNAPWQHEADRAPHEES